MLCGHSKELSIWPENTHPSVEWIKNDDWTNSQVSFGIDATHGRWFANANWYEPISSDRIDIVRTPTEITETRRSQFSGWDAEIGAVVFTDANRPVNLLLALGYYDFSNAFGSISGVRARADLIFWEHFSLAAEWRENGIQFGQEWRFTASARFAIGGSLGKRIYVPPYMPPAESVTPPAAVSSGKGVVDNLFASSSGKYAKNVLPVLPPEEPVAVGQEAVEESGPPAVNAYSPMGQGMRHLNSRVFWPSATSQITARRPIPPRSAFSGGDSRAGIQTPPPCTKCISGKPIRFD
jgi:hypothetical protein